MAKTSEGDDFATRKWNFTLEMVHLGALTMAKEAAVTDRDMSPISPAKYNSAYTPSRNSDHPLDDWSGHGVGVLQTDEYRPTLNTFSAKYNQAQYETVAKWRRVAPPTLILLACLQ